MRSTSHIVHSGNHYRTSDCPQRRTRYPLLAPFAPPESIRYTWNINETQRQRCTALKHIINQVLSRNHVLYLLFFMHGPSAYPILHCELTGCVDKVGPSSLQTAAVARRRRRRLRSAGHASPPGPSPRKTDTEHLTHLAAALKGRQSSICANLIPIDAVLLGRTAVTSL